MFTAIGVGVILLIATLMPRSTIARVEDAAGWHQRGTCLRVVENYPYESRAWKRWAGHASNSLSLTCVDGADLEYAHYASPASAARAVNAARAPEAICVFGSNVIGDRITGAIPTFADVCATLDGTLRREHYPL